MEGGLVKRLLELFSSDRGLWVYYGAYGEQGEPKTSHTSLLILTIKTLQLAKICVIIVWVNLIFFH